MECTNANKFDLFRDRVFVEEKYNFKPIRIRQETVTDAYKSWTKHGLEHKLSRSISISEVERLFYKYALAWKNETGIYSDIHSIVNNSNYIKIKDMSWKVVPFILKDLKRKPEHWFIALEYITKENPIPEKDFGDMKKMTKAWLKWGKEKGNL